ncbi:MAG: hypothetical protein ACRDJE_04515 [Dehalococcoidia bacterium]
MTQMTAEQQRLQAVAERVVDRLRTLHADLPADEQTILDAILSRAVAQGQGDDVAGYRFTRTGDLFQVLAAGAGTWIIWDREPPSFGGWDFDKPDGGTTPPGSPHP